jgi:phage terminase large subunit GpA-like protein
MGVVLVDCLKQAVSSVRKNLKNYPAKEGAIVGSIQKAIEKKKTYEVLCSLEKVGRIKEHLSHYVKYQTSTIEQLKTVIEGNIEKLIFFELLVVSHLFYCSRGEKRFDFDKFFKAQKSSVIPTVTPSISDKQFYINVLENVKTQKSKLNLYDFAETIVIPAGPYKGLLYKHSRAPYLGQIHRWMSPETNCDEIVNMWGVQIGKSTVVENAAIYYMKISPSEILAVLATDDAARKFSIKRIEPRAIGAGIKFVADNFGDSKRRSSGNTVLSKEFYGGNFDSVTAGSPSKLASETKRILFKDELDRWPDKVGFEGDPDSVADARTDTWGSRALKASVSSPTLFGVSKIYPKFLAGSQHYYHVQCPYCRAEYPLEMGYGRTSGLTYETKAGKIDSDYVFYLCPKCKDAWFEKDKLLSMQRGLWVSHAESSRDGLISTQLSGLYSPFMDWTKVAVKHKASVDDPDKEQEFTNMVLGLPFEQKGTRPDIEKTISLRDSTYKSRVVPEGVLYLVASCDVQRGSQSDSRKVKNPARLEIEILGICDSYVTKSIEYLVIKGSTKVFGEGALKELNDLMDSPYLWLIDARDGKRMDVVYEFCRYRGNRVFPSMGTSYIWNNGKNTKEDKFSSRDYKRYTKTKVDESLTMYQISTNHYKKNIYSYLNTTIERADQTGSFGGKCHFPKDYPDRYFEMLTAEEQKPDGTFMCPSGRRNEALDLRVYCLAAADIWINMYIENLKAKAKANKAKDVSHIDYIFARNLLHRDTRQLDNSGKDE